MLAKVYERKLYRPNFLAQPKLNGIRCLYQSGNLVSREGEVWSHNCLRHIREAVKHLAPGNNILDGELYCHGMSLQQINSRVAVKRVDPHKDEYSVQFHIFDYVSRLPMIERSLRLADMFRNAEQVYGVQLVPTYTTRSIIDADKHHQQFKSLGYEGTMYRCPLSSYAIVGEHKRKDNRVSWLLKRKDWLDLDATIVCVIEGNDDFEGTMGSFELDYKGTRFRAGSGPTHQERAEYWKLRDKMPGLTVKIKYEMLSDTGVPLKPVIIFTELP